MKLKEFDFKLPKDEARKNKIIITSISVITLILIITLSATFAYYQSIENQNPINTSVGEFSSGDLILAVTIDGVPSNNFPAKNAGYMVSDVTCDKGANGIWNNSLWSIKVGNLTQTKTTCNIAFISEIGTLVYEIKQQGGGASAIEAKGAPIFNTTPTAATSGIYAMEDEYGTSYYYRGERNSLNNNLIFAGFQWKIVRVNGDSSVRIIYNGTEANFNSLGTVNVMYTITQIGTSAFNANYNDNKYIGYMYGGSNGVASPTLTQAQTNQTNSTIKTYLDAWYVNNIATKGSSLTEKLADNLFCNDRQLGHDYPGAPTTGTGWNGSGFGVSVTYYSPYYRYYTNRSNLTPTFKCAQQNDRFTASDENIGNANLTYPVGLITGDEVAFAGGRYDVTYNSYYLYTNEAFWTLTSSHFNGSGAFAWFVGTNGSLDFNCANTVYCTLGVRPVLNLKSDSQVVLGNGSATSPFRII